MDFLFLLLLFLFYDTLATPCQSLTSISNVVATSVHCTEFSHQGIIESIKDLSMPNRALSICQL